MRKANATTWTRFRKAITETATSILGQVRKDQPVTVAAQVSIEMSAATTASRRWACNATARAQPNESRDQKAKKQRVLSTFG